MRHSAADLLGELRCVGCARRAGPLCGPCRARIGPSVACAPLPNVCRVLAPWAYEGPARALVLALKIRGLRPAALPLADAMSIETRRAGLRGEAVTWVPARPTSARRRGFDHAEVLARRTAALIGLPAVRLLAAAGPRLDQTELGARERRANLVDAFVARRFTRPVVLVDDLVTTGATAAACAAALAEGGTPAVEVLVPCRAG